ncbi:hypothetical protein B0T26DRAFT_743973 [Lasiosphaeria miniovina]|uniref:RING-type E3 ubiquitin transferase n=1 Tax=Lasiosphaeria miniovina TaxID=1954250 RepID=A0AA40A041_9PEZI|nr:uncharacterized protein B0T26DRAFT_743973 [Lasiosphaeria miniovina]KAK0706838.1 hypothetical protein B0T26DRAFT_743973 [Lasiosphaeria miniovina]
MASLLWILAAAALSVLPPVHAGPARIFPMDEAPAWQADFQMTLELSAQEGGAQALTYTIYPMTKSVGLNGSDVTLNVRHYGWLVPSSDNIAYLSCDPPNATNVLNLFMDPNLPAAKQPAAIVLHSEEGNCCGLEGSDLPYTSIFTMAFSEEASETMNYTDTASGTVLAVISANTTSAAQPEAQSGSNSAVAMSILYSITGLITLLFLIIIATGALRAHRYPERYGPRSGYGGRPRQSRAKGIARAVLETLPIVKFGDTTPAKADPALELEHQPSRSSHDPETGTRLSAIPEETQPPQKRQNEAALAAVTESHLNVTAASSPSADLSATKIDEHIQNENHSQDDEHLGCSICTEDFTVGEDVRVLPCDHKFHPPCIDPWLINVSGTCPLCRLDLRPQGQDASDTMEDSGQLAPPLAGDLAEPEAGSNGGSTTPPRRRSRLLDLHSSRLLDLHRLRHASVEERIEILRRHRSQQQQASAVSEQQQSPGDGDADERSRRARLADRLRDKFRIRTRTHLFWGEGLRGRGGRRESPV